MGKLVRAFFVCCMFFFGLKGSGQIPQKQLAEKDKILGMYIHQHWGYNHPYAARTWTLKDWRGYMDGLHKLGFNTILIWPILETMPDPLTPSDKANIKKIAAIIDMAHHDFNMRVAIVLCPNVAPKSEEGRKYTFETRPFYHTEDLVNPADTVAFNKLMAWREKLLRPLSNVDALFVIDSDPGGYPNSTTAEFIYILGEHRRLLDHLRPGIKLVYWAEHGWESYCKFYATGVYKNGNPDEIRNTISLLAKQHFEPWGVASHFGPHIADPLGMGDRVLAFNYGAIEKEPSFPFTNYSTTSAYEGGRDGGQWGTMGNAQSHCLQLPNTFAFARGAQGLPIEKSGYIDFANKLISGQGRLIVEGWEALQGNDAVRMHEASKRLASLKGKGLKPGSLKGLLFGDPERFINDLVLQLDAVGTMYEFRAAVSADPKSVPQVKSTLAVFINAIEAWQHKHGYSNSWDWPQMEEALHKLNSKVVDTTLSTKTFTSKEGATPFDRVKIGMALLESYTPRLIASMKQALADMNNK